MLSALMSLSNTVSARAHQTYGRSCMHTHPELNLLQSQAALTVSSIAPRHIQLQPNLIITNKVGCSPYCSPDLDCGDR